MIFPQYWPTLGQASGLRFEVTKSNEVAFRQYESVSFDLQSSSNGLYFALDPWNGTLMHYRVIVSSTENDIIDASIPLKAIDQSEAVFVSPQGADISGCGNIQSIPCKSIQAALQSAALGGSIIYATPGEYTGAGNFDIDTGGSAVYITTTNGPQYSIINCTDKGFTKRGFQFISGESDDTIVEGFTILGGESNEGGCMVIRDSSPKLNKMAFIGCKATSGSARGGAIYIEGAQSKPVIENSYFYYNQANEGGALHVTNGAALTFSKSAIDLGICASGTGLGGGMFGRDSKILIEDSIIKNCISAFGGGGMLFQDSLVTLNRVEVLRNAVTNTGAGVNLFGSTTTIMNSRIAEVRCFHLFFHFLPIHDDFLLSCRTTRPYLVGDFYARPRI